MPSPLDDSPHARKPASRSAGRGRSAPGHPHLRTRDLIRRHLNAVTVNGPVNDHVVVRLSRGLRPDYLPCLRDGAVVEVVELEMLFHHPTRPVIALPTDRTEWHGNAYLAVYEVHPLGRSHTANQ
jgi:hypothetical protein